MSHIRYFSGLLLVVLSFLAQGQSARAQKSFFVPDKMWIGGSISGGASMMFFLPSVQQSIQISEAAAVEWMHSNQNYTAFRAQLGYAHRGWGEFYPTGSGKSFSMDLHFVETAFLAHLFYPGKFWSVGFDIGPSVGYLVGHRAHAKGGAFSEQERRRHEQPIYTRLAWGLKGGPALSIHFGAHVMLLSLYAYYGFNDLYRARINDPYGRSGELYAQLSLAYLFLLF